MVSDYADGPFHDSRGHRAERGIHGRDAGIISGSRHGNGGVEAARGAHDAVAVVEDAHEEFDMGALARLDTHLEGADLDHDLVIDRQAVARLAHTGELLRLLECFREPGLHELGKPVAPLRSAQELRMLLANMNIMPLKQVVPMPMVFGDIKEDGKLSPNSEVGKGTAGMLDELAIWAAALKPTRA